MCLLLFCNNYFSGIPWGLFFCLSEHKITSLFFRCSVWTLCLPNSQVPPSLQIPQKLLFGSRVLVRACGLSWIPRACTGCQATPLGAARLWALQPLPSCGIIASHDSLSPKTPRSPYSRYWGVETSELGEEKGTEVHNVPWKSGSGFLTPFYCYGPLNWTNSLCPGFVKQLCSLFLRYPAYILLKIRVRHGSMGRDQETDLKDQHSHPFPGSLPLASYKEQVCLPLSPSGPVLCVCFSAPGVVLVFT